MRALGAAALVALSVLTTTASATPLIRATTMANEKTGVSHEIEVAAAYNESELRSLVKRLQLDLREVRRKNPDLRPEIVAAGEKELETAKSVAGQISQGGIDTETVVLTPESLEPVKSKFKDWFLKHYRVSFTIIRGISNSATVAWGLIISSDIPTEPALTVGLVAGAMASGLQFYNERFQHWLLGDGKTAGKWIRTYGVNAAYLSVVNLTSALAGVAPEPTVLLSLGAIVKTALLATVAQSPWGLAIAEQEKLSLARAPHKAIRARVMADLKVLSISMVSAGVAIAELMGVPLARVMMYGLAAGGITTYGWTLYKAKKQKSRCADLLTYLFGERFIRVGSTAA